MSAKFFLGDQPLSDIYNWRFENDQYSSAPALNSDGPQLPTLPLREECLSVSVAMELSSGQRSPVPTSGPDECQRSTIPPKKMNENKKFLTKSRVVVFMTFTAFIASIYLLAHKFMEPSPLKSITRCSNSSFIPRHGKYHHAYNVNLRLLNVSSCNSADSIQDPFIEIAVDGVRLGSGPVEAMCDDSELSFNGVIAMTAIYSSSSTPTALKGELSWKHKRIDDDEFVHMRRRIDITLHCE